MTHNARATARGDTYRDRPCRRNTTHSRVQSGNARIATQRAQVFRATRPATPRANTCTASTCTYSACQRVLDVLLPPRRLNRLLGLQHRLYVAVTLQQPADHETSPTTREQQAGRHCASSPSLPSTTQAPNTTPCPNITLALTSSSPARAASSAPSVARRCASAGPPALPAAAA